MSDEEKKTPSRAEGLAAEAMAEISRESQRETERSEREARRRGRTGQYLLLTGVALVLGVLIGLNLAGRLPFQVTIEPVSEDELRYNLRVALNYGVREIEAYRQAHGVYPQSLAAVGGPSQAGWTFERMGDDGYRLAVSSGSVSVEYDSSQDADAFFSDVRQR